MQGTMATFLKNCGLIKKKSRYQKYLNQKNSSFENIEYKNYLQIIANKYFLGLF